MGTYTLSWLCLCTGPLLELPPRLAYGLLAPPPRVPPPPP